MNEPAHHTSGFDARVLLLCGGLAVDARPLLLLLYNEYIIVRGYKTATAASISVLQTSSSRQMCHARKGPEHKLKEKEGARSP